MLYALKIFDREKGLWYIECVHKSKSFLKKRETEY